jgi:sugar phosphate isomerase/epimerase
LFVSAEEAIKFCEDFGVRLCYDISHSQLACNYFGWSLDDFTKLISKYIAHLHIVDARGFHDEGLQIGDGEIDFFALGKNLRKWAPGVPFIPEIWQGHKNSGQGFWAALARLEEEFTIKSNLINY